MLELIKGYALAVAAVGTLAGASFGADAHAAQNAVDVRSVTVRYTDLNLNTAAGVDALYARLRDAANAVCGHHAGRALVDVVARRDCYGQALSAAVNSVQSSTLQTLHRRATGDAAS
jgi:UrcA family protein